MSCPSIIREELRGAQDRAYHSQRARLQLLIGEMEREREREGGRERERERVGDKGREGKVQ